MSSAIISYPKERTLWELPPIRVKAFVILFSMTLVVAIGLLSVSVFESWRASRANTLSSIVLPPDGIGVYESCSLDGNLQNCEQRLQTIAHAGFKLVVNYDEFGASPSEAIAYLDQAKALGIKIIFAMNDPAIWQGKVDLKTIYPAFGQTCQCATNADFIAAVVNTVKNHPALWGYYVGDEVPTSDHAIFASYAAMIHQLDPNHPRLFITAGQSDPSFVALLRPFTDTADVIGDDYYPVGDNPSTGTVQDTGRMASSVQQVADASNKGSAVVLQAFNWNQYPNEYPCMHNPATCNAFPTEAQMQSMLQQTLQSSHPRMVLWYSYYNILSSDNPTQHWNDLQQAIQNVNAQVPAPRTPTPSLQTPTARKLPTATPIAQSTPQPSKAPVAAASTAIDFPWRFFLAMGALQCGFVSVFVIRMRGMQRKR